MHITTYTLDGAPGPTAELTKDPQATLRLNGAPVLAVGLWGSLVALTLVERLVLIRVGDYARVSRFYGLDLLSRND